MKESFQDLIKKLGVKLRGSKGKIYKWWGRAVGKYPRLFRWVKRLTIFFGSLFVLFFLFLIILLLSVPTVRQLKYVQTQIASDIYTIDSLLLGRYYNEYRTVILPEQVPSHLFEALVATEDERFFTHQGIDYRSWGRVFVRTVLQGDESGGGGSTISQQLAKNLFPRKDYGAVSIIINKFREIIIATRLEKAYEKHEILTLYLNTVPFPDNVYGIDVAARRFFSKSPFNLTVEEGATLVGSLRATTYYNPVRNPEQAKTRRNVVLGQMYKNNYLERDQLDSLKELPIDLVYNSVINNEGIVAPYFKAFVRKELEDILKDYKKPDGTAYNLYTDGLKVYTTLHGGIQQLAEEAVKEHLSQVQATFNEHWRNRTAPWTDVETIKRSMRTSARYKLLSEKGLSEEKILAIFEEPVTMEIFTWEGKKEVTMSPLDSVKYHLGILQVGFLVMEPRTGHILAWVGGTDFDFVQYDHVRARRQTGSVFKPIVYTQALKSEIDPCEQIPNKLLVFHEYAKGEWYIKDPRRDDPEPHFDTDGTDLDDWIPQNADGKYGGSYSLAGALTNSVNTATVNLIMQTGVEPVIETAYEMGITSEIPKEPSIALGTAEVSLYEMIRPFAVLANQGKQVKPIAISKIETPDGNTLVSFEQDTTKQVVSKDIAQMVTYMLDLVTTQGTASRLRWKFGLYDLPIAGKTGTSQNHADGWFIGYTPKLVAGAWVGGDSPLVRFRNFENGQGAATALPIWALFMRNLKKENELAEKWYGGEFEEFPLELRKKFYCPLRIKSPEEILADSLLQDSLARLELEGGLDSLQILEQQ